jgi:hypothetical protein
MTFALLLKRERGSRTPRSYLSRTKVKALEHRQTNQVGSAPAGGTTSASSIAWGFLKCNNMGHAVPVTRHEGILPLWACSNTGVTRVETERDRETWGWQNFRSLVRTFHDY